MRGREAPSLGGTPEAVWGAWRRLSEAPQWQRRLVVGVILGEGVYSWRYGRVVREFKTRASRLPRGYVAWIRPATDAELNRLWLAIERGWFQVEGRRATGCIGLNTDPDAGETVVIFHQARGKAIVLTPKEEGALEGLASITQTARRAMNDNEVHDRPLKDICERAKSCYEMILSGLAPDVKEAVRENVPL